MASLEIDKAQSDTKGVRERTVLILPVGNYSDDEGGMLFGRSLGIRVVLVEDDCAQIAFRGDGIENWVTYEFRPKRDDSFEVFCRASGKLDSIEMRDRTVLDYSTADEERVIITFLS
ncbi:MAG: hypothetical protein ABID04_00385 [Patescibacteria group bacterium]